MIDEKPVRIDADEQTVEFNWTPAETGRFIVAAETDPVPGELVTQNNRAEREVNVRDDFLRLMFVEFEPTWEWRFIKEVFHRDKLVGQRGFRTFLRSADPAVRRSNELFLPTLTPRRSEFFANDVIFLGRHATGSRLGPRFCEMTKEFVGKFGGGLVVVAGPRFGPGQLADTPLADMLPVVVDPAGRVREDHSFALQLTPDAAAWSISWSLGASDREKFDGVEQPRVRLRGTSRCRGCIRWGRRWPCIRSINASTARRGSRSSPSAATGAVKSSTWDSTRRGGCDANTASCIIGSSGGR